MKRREFITLLGALSGAVAWPLPARAQQQPATPVIGILHSQTQTSEAARITAIQQGLKEAGFVPGRNVTVEHRL
jgi:putative tryptophan/tyrosine transport system substrate-binding protein